MTPSLAADSIGPSGKASWAMNHGMGLAPRELPLGAALWLRASVVIGPNERR
jgi:hypothetical protein